MPVFAPPDVLVGDNEFSAVMTAVGTDPVTGLEAPYHGGSVVAFWSDAEASDTALGSVSVSCPEIGSSGDFLVAMEASQLVTALGALAGGTTVYLIGKAPGDWRRFAAFTVRKAGAFL